MQEQKATLPNGQSVYHLNQYETDFMYDEIFNKKIYVPDGILLNEASLVIDIGANIGLFSLFIKQEFPKSTIYAFEPSLQLFDLLKLNLKQFASGVKIFQAGVSSREGEATFSYYPKYSILSGFFSDINEDSKILNLAIKNKLRGAGVKEEYLNKLTDNLRGDKLKEKIEYQCGLTTLSAIIERNDIKRIDLLKIDAEKSELDILQGIKKVHWERINQIIMEIHDVQKSLIQEITAILKANGYQWVIKEEKQFIDSGVSNIFAKREKQNAV